MLVTSLNTAASTMAVKRAARGTTLAAHSTDDEIKVNHFPRKVVFDAVVDQINNLFPTLFAVETVESVTSSDGYTLLGTYDSPGTNNYLISVLKAISQYTDFSSGSDQTGTIFQPVSVELIDLIHLHTQTTQVQRTITYTSGPNAVKALQFYSINKDILSMLHLRKVCRPTAESDTLSTVGLEDEYDL